MATFSAPDACTLPTAVQPLREAELAALVWTARAVTREGPTTLRLEFAAEPGRADAIDDLARRENACCSFFDFRLVRDDEGLVLHVAVPATQVGVLDGLQALAQDGPGDADR